MKTFLTLLFLVVAATGLCAQSVTNLQIQAIIKLDNGQSYTNSASSNNTNMFSAFTNAMNTLNLRRANLDPPKPAVTNLSQAFIEINKEHFKQFKDEYDFNLSQLLNQKIPVLTEAQKEQIRSIVQ